MTRVWIAMLFACGCSPEAAEPSPQWLVTIHTDAPVPQLGDRLLVELGDGENCSDCRRQIGVGEPDAWPHSFGVVPGQGGASMRIRLHRTALLGPDAAPVGDALIDVTHTLPAVSELSTADVALPTSCFGQGPCAAFDGVLDVGSWEPARSRGCTTAAPPGMVCIPGGAFLRGHPRPHTLGDGELIELPERLVLIDPFYLDAAEVDVATLTALRSEHPELEQPLVSVPGIDYLRQCTWGLPDTQPSRPANCVSRKIAASICAAQDKRLPTEAEWEWAAGRRHEETLYPWGNVDTPCAFSIVARAELLGAKTICRSDPTACGYAGTTLPPGPVAGGCAKDVTADGARDLAGNVSEWVADAFAPYTDACFGPPSGVLDNPFCEQASAPSAFAWSTRGAHFRSRPIEARVTTRFAHEADLAWDEVGFRCARDAPSE